MEKPMNDLATLDALSDGGMFADAAVGQTYALDGGIFPLESGFVIGGAIPTVYPARGNLSATVAAQARAAHAAGLDAVRTYRMDDGRVAVDGVTIHDVPLLHAQRIGQARGEGSVYDVRRDACMYTRMPDAGRWQDLATEWADSASDAGPRARAESEVHLRGGMAYLWGAQDALGFTDSDVALAFGYMRALEYLRFESGESPAIRAIGDAYARACTQTN